MLRAANVAAAMGGVLLLACAVHAANVSTNEQARGMLERVLPAGVVIDFRAVPLKDALEFVRDVTAANIHVNWKALEAANVLPETGVTVHLRGVPLRKVLYTMLSEAGGQKLTWYVSDGTIEVTTKELADSIVFVRVYAIEDLLVEPPQNDPMMGAMPMGPMMMGQMGNGGYNNNWGGGRSGWGSGRDYTMSQRGNMWQGNGMNSSWPGMSPLMPGMNSWSMPGVDVNRTNTDGPDKKARELIEAIRATVYPAYWEDGKASIKYFKGKLIIRAPRCVHEALAGPMD